VVVLLTQLATSVNIASQQSHYVDDTYGWTPKSNTSPLLISEHHFQYLKYLPERACVKESECGNTINGANFCIVLYSNYGPILLSFKDMTMRQTKGWMDNG